jgi:hypothetical protein
MPIGKILDIGLLVASIAVLLWLTPAAIANWRTYVGTGRRRQEDATGRAPDPEPEVVERMNALEARGYRRIGETRTRTPGDEVIAWILAAGDGASYAMLTESFSSAPGLTGFYSAWPDGTWLGTIHPRGDPLEYRGLRLRIDAGRLEDAEASHRAELRRLAAGLGPPRAVRELGDVLILDADYRTRFGGRELRPLLVRSLAPAVVALVLTVFSVVLVFGGR